MKEGDTIIALSELVKSYVPTKGAGKTSSLGNHNERHAKDRQSAAHREAISSDSIIGIHSGER